MGKSIFLSKIKNFFSNIFRNKTETKMLGTNNYDNNEENNVEKESSNITNYKKIALLISIVK